MKIVKIPKDSYDIQVWNHGVGFKNDNLDGERDTNGFLHTHTGLGVWRGYEIKLIYEGMNFIWILLKKNII